MIQEHFTPSWSFWFLWLLAFLGFPIGGLLAQVTIGPVTNAIKATLAGALTGAVLGLVQWFVLSRQLPLSVWWIPVTSAGMAIGMGISVALLGTETSGNSLLQRAFITGLSIGIAQWVILRMVLPGSALWSVWIAVIAIGWMIGWFVTRKAGVDLSHKWPVFGASGALTFQFITGLALYFILRLR